MGFENHALIGRSLPQIKFGQPQVHCSNESSRQHPLPLIDEAIYNTAPLHNWLLYSANRGGKRVDTIQFLSPEVAVFESNKAPTP